MILGVENLTVRYPSRSRPLAIGTGEENTILKELSFEVRKGSVYALLGRNGSGKSTLVRCLIGQQRSAAGRAILLGMSSWHERARAMARVGVMPEEPNLAPALTALDHARLCTRLHARWDLAGFKTRLEQLAVPLDLPCSTLSRGHRAQVQLALALGHHPEVLVLDDPSLGLDSVARTELFRVLVTDLADHGTTVLLTSHELAAVEGIADRVGILRDGRLVIDESLETLKARRASSLDEIFRGAA